jgi:UDP-N-acetylglucosamine diphosphorylase/glucosamine-1-phosphate N-acetyltransferase
LKNSSINTKKTRKNRRQINPEHMDHDILLIDFQKDQLSLLPFTYTRPISEIRLGILRLSEKWEKYLKPQKIYYLSSDYLSTKFPSAKEQNNTLIINSVLIPNADTIEAVNSLSTGEVLLHDQTFLACKYSGKKIENKDTFWMDLRPVQYKGTVDMLQHKWEIFQKNPSEIAKDFNLICTGRKSAKADTSNILIGPEELVFIEEGSKVRASIINTEEGPVYIGKNAEIMEGSMIRGPFALCDHSTVKMGAKIYSGTTIGPHCKIGGEVNNSVIFGYSNKAHDGFLGNAVIGEWCNLGADTNNSNLKNNYDFVKVWDYARNTFISTDSQFCGLFMGDHSKTGINTMLNTGTTIGVFVNVYGSNFPRTFIPSFSWGSTTGFMEYKSEKAFETAQRVMSRRGIDFNETEEEILKHIFEFSRKYRK